MKKVLLAGALIAGFVLTPRCAAQYNAFKFDALGAFNNRLGLSYERNIGRHFSALLTFERAKYTYTLLNQQQEVYKLTGYGFLPECRYYPFTKNKPAPLGFFLGAAGRYVRLTEESAPAQVRQQGKVVNLGLNAGYKFNVKQALIEVLGGYGGGRVSGFGTEARRQLAFYRIEPDYDFLREFLRVEVSVGLVIPQVKTN